jgi:A/G-specific adenine glycosylase
VGPYTKGAVLSIAFDRPLPALDGNVERVLTRLLALDGDPKRKPVRTRMNEIVRALHEHGRPGEINQALMELGATVCTPRKPSCLVCPWHDGCRARRQGRTEELPRLSRRQQPLDVTTKVCLIERENRVLARRVDAGAINEGQLCLPGLGLPVPLGDDLRKHLEASHGLRGTPGEHLTTIRHGITRYRVRIEVYTFSPVPPFARPGRGLVYESPGDDTRPWTTVARKVFAKLRRRRR